MLRNYSVMSYFCIDVAQIFWYTALKFENILRGKKEAIVRVWKRSINSKNSLVPSVGYQSTQFFVDEF